jgi:hypothetical protein
MNTYKIYLEGTYRVSTLIEAESPAQALETIHDEWGVELVEELILQQGVDNWECTKIVPIKENVGYIAKSNGNLFHQFFESRAGLIEHLRQRSNALYIGAINDDELFDFFLARNYFRVV